jgi:hypothetical protein
MNAIEAPTISSPNSSLADQLFKFMAPLPAVVRPVGDQTSSGNYGCWVLGIKNLSILTSSTTGQRDAVVVDRWLIDTIKEIKQYNCGTGDFFGLAEQKPSPIELQDAEYLAALFANTPAWQRPMFAIDAAGAPTFERRTTDFYLHLTIDRPGQLSWYALKDGEEDFGDDYQFDRRSLPQSLVNLGM